MSSNDGGPPRAEGEAYGSFEYLLFDSLVHHLIEKGLLTRNDALSVVQTVAEVVRGRIGGSDVANDAALATLERTYSSFEALPDRYGGPELDGHNVRALRIPLHGDQPKFPRDDD